MSLGAGSSLSQGGFPSPEQEWGEIQEVSETSPYLAAEPMKWSKTERGAKAVQVRSHLAKTDMWRWRKQMGPQALSNTNKMPMRKSSFSSHLIKTVFGKKLCSPFAKIKKGRKRRNLGSLGRSL